MSLLDARPVGPNEDYLVSDADSESIVVFERLRNGTVRVMTGESNGSLIEVRRSPWVSAIDLRPGGEVIIASSPNIVFGFCRPVGLSNSE